MEQKRTFKMILAIFAIMMALLPFVTTFNSVLTKLINQIGAYRLLQNNLVPLETRMVIKVVQPLGISAYLAPKGEEVSFYLKKGSKYFPVKLEWNCLGWQSLLLLGLSLVVGLQGRFTRFSKMECILIGILGTFLVNIFRMVFITAGLYYFNSVFALLIHDYFAAFVAIIWFLFFWWFSYRYVLEGSDIYGRD